MEYFQMEFLKVYDTGGNRVIAIYACIPFTVEKEK
jgi:hypothetical protein